MIMRDIDPYRKRNVTLSASIVCLSQLNLESIIEGVARLGVDRLHIDLIDQSFGSPGLPVEIIGDLRKRFDIPIDVHIMITKPLEVVDSLINEGADAICIHQSALSERDLSKIKRVHEFGVELGLVLNPSEIPNESLIRIMNPRRLTVMTVQPGGAGRPFVKNNLKVIKQCSELVKQSSVETVEADGAIGPKTIKDIVLAGATQGVIGSTVFPFRTLARNRINELNYKIKSLEEECDVEQ